MKLRPKENEQRNQRENQSNQRPLLELQRLECDKASAPPVITIHQMFAVTKVSAQFRKWNFAQRQFNLLKNYRPIGRPIAEPFLMKLALAKVFYIIFTKVDFFISQKRKIEKWYYLKEYSLPDYLRKKI